MEGLLLTMLLLVESTPLDLRFSGIIEKAVAAVAVVVLQMWLMFMVFKNNSERRKIVDTNG